jgi:hypothetical protein
MSEKEKKKDYTVWTALSLFFVVDIAIGLLIRKYFSSKRPPSSASKGKEKWVNWEDIQRQKTQSYHSTNSYTYRPYESFEQTYRTHSQSSHRPEEQIQYVPYLDRHLRNLEMKTDMGHPIPSQTEVKQAYRNICLKTHPDVLGVDHPNKQQAEKKFIEATSSYNYLLKHLPK